MYSEKLTILYNFTHEETGFIFLFYYSNEYKMYNVLYGPLWGYTYFLCFHILHNILFYTLHGYLKLLYIFILRNFLLYLLYPSPYIL